MATKISNQKTATLHFYLSQDGLAEVQAKVTTVTLTKPNPCRNMRQSPYSYHQEHQKTLSSPPAPQMPKIRAATLADYPAIQAIHEECRSAAEWLPASGRLTSSFAQASIGEDVFVAIGEDKQLIGFVSVWMAEPFIHHLYIKPSHQRFGIGRALLIALQQWLPLPWQLKCLIKNTAALDFYLSQGWIAVGTGEGEDGIFITLQLERG
ncbi:MAG: hypothetical protein RL571_1097 [Pseudomonadota bacterium]|jgi:GNAT superfamily N-acetyltransferase